MKYLIVLAATALVATSANAAEMKWSGSAGWRYDQDSLDNGSALGTSKDKTHGLRANIGVTGGWENVEWGTSVRTVGRGGAKANDDHVELTNNLDPGVGFEQAWVRWVRDFGVLDLSVTAGRQKNVFAYDTVAQTLFDNDVRFDGFGEQLKFGMFGLNLGEYVLGSNIGANPNVNVGPANSTYLYGTSVSSNSDANGGQRLAYMFGIQPHMNWKFTDEIEAMIGVGYYIWNDNQQVNSLDGVKADRVNTANGTATLPGFRFNNSRQLQVVATVSLPYNLSFNGEWIMNRKQSYDAGTVVPSYSGVGVNGGALAVAPQDADRSAWSLGLTYGAIKKAHDFSVGYAYGQKGLASVMNNYSYENYLANNKGHTIEVNYAVADNFTVGWKGLFLKEMKDVVGTANNKTNYWELTGGVMF